MTNKKEAKKQTESKETKKAIEKKTKEKKIKLTRENINKAKKDLKVAKKVIKKKSEESDETYKSVSFSLVEVIVIILITGIVVSICSGLIVFNNYDNLITPEKDNNGKISELIESYNHIMESYVEKVDGEKLIDFAISAMYAYLGDSYSGYIDSEATNDIQEQLKGEYEGIGIEITSTEETITITKVFADTPAQKAGLKVGDIIIKVDGESYKGKDANDVSNYIKKGKKDTFEIVVKRGSEEKSLTIKREKVVIESVLSETYDNIGYIKIDTFSEMTQKLIKEKLDKFDSNINKLIIDVRDNSGGYLSSAYETSDLFVEKNKIVYKLKDRNGKITNYIAKNKVYKEFDDIVVLINESSASASEILASALKESADATLIGKKSYGKGTVQETEILTSGAMVKYTSSYWLTPNGNSINKIGVIPDIEVNMEKTDTQLKKAIDFLK